jgi:hypothetical protein
VKTSDLCHPYNNHQLWKCWGVDTKLMEDSIALPIMPETTPLFAYTPTQRGTNLNSTNEKVALSVDRGIAGCIDAEMRTVAARTSSSSCGRQPRRAPLASPPLSTTAVILSSTSMTAVRVHVHRRCTGRESARHRYGRIASSRLCNVCWIVAVDRTVTLRTKSGVLLAQCEFEERKMHVKQAYAPLITH